MEDMFLREKVAVVTGGGRGLGEAISRRLALAGAITCIADMRKAEAEQVAESINNEGGQAQAYELNVTDPQQVAEVAQQIESNHGGVDILVNNAGTDVTKPLEDLTDEDWNKVIGTNLNGPFFVTRAMYQIMKKRQSGHIINIASTASKSIWTETSAYHASKWGLLGFSHATHAEGRRENIKVSAVVAGGMATPFVLERFPNAKRNLLQDPRNVAETVCFLLSMPADTVIPEVMVIPTHEPSWP